MRARCKVLPSGLRFFGFVGVRNGRSGDSVVDGGDKVGITDHTSDFVKLFCETGGKVGRLINVVFVRHRACDVFVEDFFGGSLDTVQAVVGLLLQTDNDAHLLRRRQRSKRLRAFPNALRFHFGIRHQTGNTFDGVGYFGVPIENGGSVLARCDGVGDDGVVIIVVGVQGITVRRIEEKRQIRGNQSVVCTLHTRIHLESIGVVDDGIHQTEQYLSAVGIVQYRLASEQFEQDTFGKVHHAADGQIGRASQSLHGFHDGHETAFGCFLNLFGSRQSRRSAEGDILRTKFFRKFDQEFLILFFHGGIDESLHHALCRVLGIQNVYDGFEAIQNHFFFLCFVRFHPFLIIFQGVDSVLFFQFSVQTMGKDGTFFGVDFRINDVLDDSIQRIAMHVLEVCVQRTRFARLIVLRGESGINGDVPVFVVFFRQNAP